MQQDDLPQDTFHWKGCMKIRPLEAELFHADGRTDRHDEANKSLFAILRTRLKAMQLDVAHAPCF